MLVLTNDPNAPKQLQVYFMIAASCENEPALKAVVEDVVRLKREGIEPVLKLSYHHPMARIANAMFEARGLQANYTMV